jgi:ABC-type sugar transport system ATPase subunit
LREEIRSEIWELVKSLRITVLYVTHDQIEAMAIADQIAVMHEGRILQVGSPLELYRNPQSQIVAEFFGSMNWIEGELAEGGKIRSEIGVLDLKVPQTISQELVFGCRFEDVQINDGPADPGDRSRSFQGRILRKVFLGDFTLYDIEVEQRRKIRVKVHGHDDWSGTVTLTIPREKLVIFPRERQTV